MVAARSPLFRTPVRLLQTLSRRQQFDTLGHRYRGTTAATYEQRRDHESKWHTENTVVEQRLNEFARGATLLDIPVGTGRFLRLYEQLGITATGMDVSPDMLRLARQKSTQATLRTGDIRSIEAVNGTFDCALCIRFLNWVDENALRAALLELARVSRRHVLVGIRTWEPSRGASLRQRLRLQLARWRARPQGRIIVHDEDTVQDVFEAAGLTLHTQDLVEQTGDATIYRIYHLTKA